MNNSCAQALHEMRGNGATSRRAGRHLFGDTIRFDFICIIWLTNAQFSLDQPTFQQPTEDLIAKTAPQIVKCCRLGRPCSHAQISPPTAAGSF